MLLQIIDKPVEDKQKYFIEIVFIAGDQLKTFVTEYCPASFPGTLKNDLAWYFKDYLNPDSVVGNDRSVVDRLINHGKYMGDRLVGDDLQLMSYREEIEEFGYSTLSVSIESVRIGFFEEPWEALILPDSKYVLSSVSKSFVRRFSDSISDRSDNVLEYGLTKESPLRILHAVHVSESADAAMRSFTTAAYGAAHEQLQYDGAIDYELLPLDDRHSVKEYLSHLSVPVHIFRYDGPLTYRQNIFYLSAQQNTSGETAPVSLLELVESLKILKCGLLILNVTEWLSDSSQSIAADTGLALAAQISMGAGMPNVLGLSNVTDPWTSNNCLNHVYKGILKGLSLSQSVVEARKALQKQSESELLSFSLLPFQSWPLLVHYERLPVVFFSSPQVAMDILHTQIYADLRRKMHGFHSEYLPPYMDISGDSSLLASLTACKSETGVVVHIHGEQGIGKTLLLHMLAFCLLRHGCGQAFYFDYGEYFYSADDIEEMTAPIISAQGNEEDQVGDTGHCIFMLDNFSSSCLKPDKIEDSSHAGLGQCLNELIASRHIIVIASADSSVPFAGEWSQPIIQVAMQPLNPAEQRHMTSRLFKKQGIDVKECHSEVNALLERCRGNPFLIKHVMPKFVAASHRELAAKVDRLFGDRVVSDCVDSFYNWQWRELPAVLKRWLILLVDLRGVILEMLAVVCDSTSRFEPVSKLYDIIGSADSAFSEGIELLEKSGFTVQYPAGRVINPRCIAFINRQAAEDQVIAAQQKALSLLLSRIVCRSLAIVIPEVLKKSDQSIVQNLVSNRKQWAKHLGAVWKVGEYAEFWAALSPLSELLRRMNLSEELAKWALHVLSASNETDLQTNLPLAEFLKAWVKLVSLALRAEEATKNEAIRQTVEFCDQWIKNIAGEQAAQQAALFTGVVQFLQTYYRKTRQWNSLQSICEIALREYRQHEAWSLAVPTLNLLIECCSKTGNSTQAQAFEHQLLADIPLDGFPAGFKWQLKTNIVTGRLDRGEFNAGQELLDQMYNSADAGHQRQLLDMLQADIYYRQEKFADAALLYERLMKSADGEAHTANREFFRQRYAEIEIKLGVGKSNPALRQSGSDTQTLELE